MGRWRNRKRVKKKRIVWVADVQSATSTNGEQRRSSLFYTAYVKKSRRRRRRKRSFVVIFFYPFLCLSLSKFQHVFTPYDTTTARPHFVKSCMYIACLTTIINVHSPNGTNSISFFSLVARKVTVIGQKVNYFPDSHTLEAE